MTAYRIIADENVEPGTRRYLRQLGRDVEWVGDVVELGTGASDVEIAAYSSRTCRLVLTQDDDFLTDVEPADTAGVLFQRDQQLSWTQVGDAIDEMSAYIPQEELQLEYVSTNWL